MEFGIGTTRDYGPNMDERVLGTFVKPDGTLLTIPRKRSKLLVVLEHLSQRFTPGQTYPEAEVNDLLAQAHPDFAALRRYLVDEGFLGREDGIYWRTGETVDA